MILDLLVFQTRELVKSDLPPRLGGMPVPKLSLLEGIVLRTEASCIWAK